MENYVKTDKISDSEAKVMNIIWDLEPVSAKDISVKIEEMYGWKQNTTYTVITKLIGKGVVKREDPGYLCSSLVTRAELQKSEARNLIDKLFSGSRKALFSSLLEDEQISSEELAFLRNMIGKL
ncbi:MAG: BlaI/MecI/CopY family transcriptional regulator [Lachnospiraceae bacterium]|nr:BlaI/MecI/CopY family transcriptional regulator [Lachnospiraceae bacterium]